jgi:drug/metabolite transporter (DMT)-like permease
MLPAVPAAIGGLKTARPATLAAAIYLGVVPTVVAYVLGAAALQRMPATRAASFLYLLPAITIVIAWPWLGEFTPPLALAGGALALTGVAIASRQAQPPPDTPHVAEDDQP